MADRVAASAEEDLSDRRRRPGLGKEDGSLGAVSYSSASRIRDNGITR